LNRTIKTFIKKLCCTPELLSLSDFERFGFQLREEEKCHVNILVVEARRQAQLMYFIRSLE
jgi:sestrin